MIPGIAPLRGTDPRRLGPYRLYGVLGAGSAGTVYLGKGPARRGARRRGAAVRALRPELLRDRQVRARIRRDTDALAAAPRSPFVADVLGCELDSESPWIASEFVPGRSLAELVAQYGPLPEPSVRALGGALCRALSVLHNAGVPHRDLRAANVLLAAASPRVADHGLGIVRAAPGAGGDRSASGWDSGGWDGWDGWNGLGTGSEDGAARPADDVFALGALLVLAAGARPPFAGSMLPAAREAPDLTGVPVGLHPVLLSCLHKDPESRPLPGMLARTFDLSDTADRPAAEWLPEVYVHDIDARADAARALVGRRLSGR